MNREHCFNVTLLQGRQTSGVVHYATRTLAGRHILFCTGRAVSAIRFCRTDRDATCKACVRRHP